MPVDVEVMEDRELDSLVSLRLLTRNTRLVEARKAKGWTQKQFALAMGRSFMWIINNENLRRVPTEAEQAAFGEVLGDTPSYLFPPTLMAAIKAGVFVERDAHLEEPQVAALTAAQYQRLTYDGETEMIEELDRNLLTERIGEALETLDPRSRRVLEWRFGLKDGRSRTLEEVGKELGLSRTRISQIEAKALKILRRRKFARRLKPFFD